MNRNGKVRVGRFLFAATILGALLSGGCTGDIRHNVVKGLLGFVEDFSADVADGLVPDINEFFPGIPE